MDSTRSTYALGGQPGLAGGRQPPISNRRHATIDRKVYARDEARFVRRKEQGGRRDLLRAAEPPERTAAANWARAWSAPSLVGACCSKIGVSIGPEQIALTRMRRSFNSAVQVRTKERTAALVAL